MGNPIDINELLRRQYTQPPEIAQLQQQLQQYPHRENYQPSRLRNVLGDVAGVASGIMSFNPAYGMSVAEGIHDQPYNRAVEHFQQDTMPYQERAQTAMAGITAQKTAQQAEEERLKGISHIYEDTSPYLLGRYGKQPQTEEEILARYGAEHPTKPAAMIPFHQQGDIFNPNDMTTKHVTAPIPHSEPMTNLEREKLENSRNQSFKDVANINNAGRLAGIRLTADLRAKHARDMIRGYSAGEQKTAEETAINELLNEKPEYQQFINSDARSKGRNILKPDNSSQYKAFLAAKDLRKLEILKKKQTGTGDWEAVDTQDEEE